MTIASQQEYDPWGKVRSGGISQTSINYTGQRLDGSGLLYYHARMYDPVLGRFVSADSVVPGSASGSMEGIALKPLTVDFHEPGFVSKLNGENGQPFWFQMDDQQRQEASSPWGPANPQALNRYSYVLNNPVRYTDPSGHQCGAAATAPACIARAAGAAGVAGAVSAPEMVATAGVVGVVGLGVGGYLWAMQEPMPPYTEPANYAVPASDTTGIRATVPDGTGMGTTATLDTPIIADAAKAKGQQKARNPNPPAARERYNTKKGAYEAAKRAGKGNEPVNDPDGEHGPHYHPGDGKGGRLNHDHYYYPNRRR